MIPRTVAGYLACATVAGLLAYANSHEIALPSEEGQLDPELGISRGYGWPLCYYVDYPGGYISPWELAAFDVDPVYVSERPFFLGLDVLFCLALVAVTGTFIDLIVTGTLFDFVTKTIEVISEK
ncbi:hypothetical protein GC197_07100 [bacterium]|nr:hypothetical protein [bacterium]